MWPRMHFLDLQQLDCWLNDCMYSTGKFPAYNVHTYTFGKVLYLHAVLTVKFYRHA